jgi:hypothetical protein
MTYPTFSVGEILTAASMNAVGMWLVKTQTVGTGVSSVEVTGAFSSDYDNYKIIYTGGTESSLALCYVTLGSTVANYYGARTSTNVNGAAAFAGDNNAGAWTFAGVGNATWMQMDFELFAPQRASRTFIHAKYWEGSGALGTYTGYQDSNTQYTSFKLVPQPANTLTGGTIRVYGYRN